MCAVQRTTGSVTCRTVQSIISISPGGIMGSRIRAISSAFSQSCKE
jgi:hypothetical protein